MFLAGVVVVFAFVTVINRLISGCCFLQNRPFLTCLNRVKSHFPSLHSPALVETGEGGLTGVFVLSVLWFVCFVVLGGLSLSLFDL